MLCNIIYRRRREILATVAVVATVAVIPEMFYQIFSCSMCYEIICRRRREISATVAIVATVATAAVIPELLYDILCQL